MDACALRGTKGWPPNGPHGRYSRCARSPRLAGRSHRGGETGRRRVATSPPGGKGSASEPDAVDGIVERGAREPPPAALSDAHSATVVAAAAQRIRRGDRAGLHALFPHRPPPPPLGGPRRGPPPRAIAPHPGGGPRGEGCGPA